MNFEGDSVRVSAGVVPYLVLCVVVTTRYVLDVSILMYHLGQFFGCDLVSWWNVCGSDNESGDCFAFTDIVSTEVIVNCAMISEGILLCTSIMTPSREDLLWSRIRSFL